MLYLVVVPLSLSLPDTLLPAIAQTAGEPTSNQANLPTEMDQTIDFGPDPGIISLVACVTTGDDETAS